MSRGCGGIKHGIYRVAPRSRYVKRLASSIENNVQGDILQLSTTTYLRHAEPHVAVRLVVVEVKLELGGLIRFEVERLEFGCFSVGLDLAVVFSIRVHFQRTGVLLAIVEGDFACSRCPAVLRMCV